MKNAIQPAAICLVILWCLTAMCSPKSLPTVQPAPEVTTTTSTEAKPQDVAVVPVPSFDPQPGEPSDYLHSFVPSVDSPLLCHVCGESARGGNHGSVTQPVIQSQSPTPASPPARTAATATGRAYSACGPGTNCSGPAMAPRQYVPQNYQPRRRLFGRFR